MHFRSPGPNLMGLSRIWISNEYSTHLGKKEENDRQRKREKNNKKWQWTEFIQCTEVNQYSFLWIGLVEFRFGIEQICWLFVKITIVIICFLLRVGHGVVVTCVALWWTGDLSRMNPACRPIAYSLTMTLSNKIMSEGVLSICISRIAYSTQHVLYITCMILT